MQLAINNRRDGRSNAIAIGAGAAGGAVFIRVGRAVNPVVYAVPGVANGGPGFVPAQAALGLGAFPIVAQLGFDLFELAAGVTGAGFPAMLVGRAVVFLVGHAGLVVGTGAVVLRPVFRLGGRIDVLSDGLARRPATEAASDRTGDATD